MKCNKSKCRSKDVEILDVVRDSSGNIDHKMCKCNTCGNEWADYSTRNMRNYFKRSKVANTPAWQKFQKNCRAGEKRRMSDPEYAAQVREKQKLYASARAS